MPTPFTHLLISHQLLQDPALSDSTRQLITAYPPDFLLGGIVADVRPDGMERADTHFYHYTQPMPDNPWREMFRQHPTLRQPQSPEHHAFLAGYVAHLAADEYWSRYMLKPHFAEGAWGEDMKERFFALHLLLIHIDERDEQALKNGMTAVLRQGEPHHWLPFLTDEAMRGWRDFIADQLESTSKTLEIFGGRIKTPPDELRRMLNDAALMQARVWDNVTPGLLARIEAELYAFARQQLDVYVTASP